MQQKIINTGLLAFGMSGKVFHAPFLDAHSGFNFAAVVERTKKLAQKEYPSVKSFNQVDELLADENIDLVVINTPNYTHYDYAKQALNAGKHILVEKPFTATSEDAKELFTLAEKVNRKIFVYQNRRYDSGFNSFKNVIDSGQLGKLVEVHFRFDRYRNEIGPKSFKEEPMPASGLLYDLGAHLVDQAIFLFGRPSKFYKTLSKNRVGTKVDDYFAIHLIYPELNVFLSANMLVADIQPAFVVNGMKGSFVKNHADVQEDQLKAGIKPTDDIYGIEKPEDAGKLTLVTENGGREIENIVSPKGDYMQFFDAVYLSLTQNMPFPVKEDDIIAQLEILES
jgi:scyllo-inositol 2-dehydrogenase (NADP+)